MSLSFTHDFSDTAVRTAFWNELRTLHTEACADRPNVSFDVTDITRELYWEGKKKQNDFRRYATWLYHLNDHLQLEETPHAGLVEFTDKWTAYFEAFFNIKADKFYTLVPFIDYKYQDAR